MLDRRNLILPALVSAVLALTYALLSGGLLARLQHGLNDWRAELLAHEVDSDIVIVGIDSHSLRELSEWPWPRRHHARLLQHLSRAVPRQVFIDIDFSARSTPDDDALLERELARWNGAPVLLAAHFQPTRQGSSELALTRPLARFAEHAAEASVVLMPSSDGLVREIQSSWRVGDSELRAAFAHESDFPAATPVAIDFSILPESFGYVSYSDLLNAEVDLAGLAGKTIYVGAVAIELGDTLAVPVFRAMPGIVAQALATETVRAGPLRSVPTWLNLLLLAALAATFTMLGRTQNWRRNLATVALACAALGGVTLWLYAEFRIDFGIAPFWVMLLGVFIALTVHKLDYETWRAVVYALGLRRQDALLTSIVESSSDCIVCMDQSGVIRTANAAAESMFGGAPGSLIGARIDAFIPDLASGCDDAFAAFGGKVSERTGLRHSAQEFPVEIAISQVAFDEEELYTAIVRDISQRKAQQKQLEYQATHDSLTGLPNRSALMSHLSSVLDAARPQQHVALLMLDLSRFKEVNDTLGHDIGDDVLREVAARLSAALDADGFIARVGGEFTVVMPGLTSRNPINELVARLIDSLKEPINVRGIAIEVGLSIGIALSPDHARDAKELLRHADVAMYTAKRHGTAMEYYDREHDSHTVRRLSMVSELRSALTRHEVELHYQPQVNLQTGRAESVEALLRWKHPMLGAVNPAEFVTLAESTDVIRPLTDWTINRAFTDLMAWKERQLDLRIAINLSARLLQDVDFPSRLGRLMRIFAVSPADLELEITESAMMLDPDRARTVVHELNALGVLISIDDYGTGYSSLGYLRDLDVHSLKLDKSFVIDLERLEHNRVIVQSTVQMAHALGLQIVAEGVETAWVEEYLKTAGYDVGQGYLFSRPMPAEQCLSWLQQFNSVPQQRAV